MHRRAWPLVRPGEVLCSERKVPPLATQDSRRERLGVRGRAPLPRRASRTRSCTGRSYGDSGTGEGRVSARPCTSCSVPCGRTRPSPTGKSRRSPPPGPPRRRASASRWKFYPPVILGPSADETTISRRQGVSLCQDHDRNRSPSPKRNARCWCTWRVGETAPKGRCAEHASSWPPRRVTTTSRSPTDSGSIGKRLVCGAGYGWRTKGVLLWQRKLARGSCTDACKRRYSPIERVAERPRLSPRSRSARLWPCLASTRGTLAER